MLKSSPLLLAATLMSLSPFAIINSAQAEGTTFGVGGIALVGPKYEGSKSYKTFGFPLIIPNFGKKSQEGSFGDRISFKSIDNVRFNILGTSSFELGPVAGYRGGRKQKDGVLLGGLGDVDAGLVLGAYAGYHLGPVFLDTSIANQVTGAKTGYQIKLGATNEFDINDSVKITTGIGSTYSSEKYMDNFFGISAAQAGTSTAGLTAYNPGAGFKDINFKLGTELALSDKWQLNVGGGYSRLIGDAANSPVIETKNQFSGSVSLIYRFGN